MLGPPGLDPADDPGVELSEQGKGIGGALMRPILAWAETERVPCATLIETPNEANVPFYRTRGLRVWAMVRDPRPAVTSFAETTP